MRTTDFPPWFWLPLRDDCEWDSIFTMHNCFDKEYGGIILALIKLLSRLFYEIPTLFLLGVVFLYQDNLTNKYILSLVIITAFPVIFTPMIWAEEYELHAEQMKPFFWEVRRGWFALAAPSLGSLVPKIIFWTSHAYEMAQEILIWGRDYVNNNLDLEVVFPDPPGGDIMSPNPHDTRAEAWMKRLVQEDKDRQKAQQDEKDKAIEVERQKEEAVLRERQREQDDISRTFKFTKNRGKQPPQRLYTRNRNRPPPSLLYEPSTTEDGEYSHIRIRVRDVDEARGKKVSKYVHKSTQTDPVDLTVEGPTRPMIKGYVSQRIQTDIPPIKEEIELPETVPEPPKVEPKLPETKAQLPETKSDAPKVEPEAKEEISDFTSKGKATAGPEPTINSHLVIVPEAPAEEQEPPNPEPSTELATIPPQSEQAPPTAIPVAEPTEPAQVTPEQVVPLPEAPITRPTPRADKTDSRRRNSKLERKRGPRRQRTLAQTVEVNADRLAHALQLDLETNRQEPGTSTIAPGHTQESVESTTSVPSSGRPNIPETIYQSSFEQNTGVFPTEEPVAPVATSFNPFADEVIPPTQSAAPEVVESWPSTEEVVTSQPAAFETTGNGTSTSPVEIQDDQQNIFIQGPSDVPAPEPSATLPPLEFQPFMLSTEIQEVTSPLDVSQSSNVPHSGLDSIPYSLLFGNGQGHQQAPANPNTTESYNPFKKTVFSESVPIKNLDAALNGIIAEAPKHRESESESHENDEDEETENEREPYENNTEEKVENEPEGDSEMTDRQENEPEVQLEPYMQSATYYGSDEEMTEVHDAQHGQHGPSQDVDMGEQDEQEVIAPQEVPISQEVEMGEYVQEPFQEPFQEPIQQYPQEHPQQYVQEQSAPQAVSSALAKLEHVEVEPVPPTEEEEEEERLAASALDFLNHLDELEDPDDAEFRNSPTETETCQPQSIQHPPATTTQPGTEAREGPRNIFSFVPSQDAIDNSPFFQRQDPYATTTTLIPTLTETLPNLDRLQPAAPQPSIFRFPELGTAPGFQTSQFPTTQAGPSIISQQNAQTIASDDPQMSQDEQDELERDMAAAFEDENASQAETVIRDPENETSEVPYLELYAQTQAAAAPPLPTNSPPHSPQTIPSYIPVNTIRVSGTPGYLLDPAKAATDEQLSKRKILKPKVRASKEKLVTPTQQQFPQTLTQGDGSQQQQHGQQQHGQQQHGQQQHGPQQGNHAHDAAIMDEAAMNLLLLAQNHGIAISGNIPPELMASSTQATTSSGPVAEEQSTTVQPTTSTEASSQQQQSVPGLTQPTSTQAQPPTSNVQGQAGPSNVQPQQPPQQQVAPMQMGGLMLPGGNPVISAPSTPAAPAQSAPQGAQRTGPQPDPRAEAFKKKKAEELKRQREAKKNTKPSLFHTPKRRGTPGTPRTPGPSTPSTPLQNSGPSTQPSALTAEDGDMQSHFGPPGSGRKKDNLNILAAGDIPEHLRDEVARHGN